MNGPNNIHAQGALLIKFIGPQLAENRPGSGGIRRFTPEFAAAVPDSCSAHYTQEGVAGM